MYAFWKRVMFLASIGWLMSCSSDLPPEVAKAMKELPKEIDFTQHVRPILSDRCFACHGPDMNHQEAGLRLDVAEHAFAELRDAPGEYAIVPRSIGKSAAIQRMLTQDPEQLMPPPSSNLALTAYEKAMLIRWVREGADFKPHWAFIPPAKSKLPKVKEKKWAQNEIDYFVLAKLEEKGLTPSQEADKTTLLRRVSIDLTGLPPSTEELNAFLADESPEAYEKAVDRLIASPHYAERMATEWLDLARYADSHGYQDDGMRTMWPWRDWVIKAFRENMPYDQFLTWQLAGDLMENPSQEQLLATAFNRNHPQTQEGGVISEEYRTAYVIDRVRTVSKAFLGLTLECSQCHDHKYDQLSQKEFYQFYSFFNNVNETGQIPYAGEASPVVILTDEKVDSVLQFVRAKQTETQASLSELAQTASTDFQQWLAKEAKKKTPQVSKKGLLMHYSFDKLGEWKIPNLADRSKPAKIKLGNTEDKPLPTEGKQGQGLELVGESFVDAASKEGYFERNEAFSAGLWIYVMDSTFGPIFSRSGGLFNGNRGYHCTLLEGERLEVSLAHVFPDNAIIVETKAALPLKQWVHIAFSYNGSSKASGLRIYIDGKPAETLVMADNLQQSMRKDGQQGNWGGNRSVRIGHHFGKTLDKVKVDEFKLYARELSSWEMLSLADKGQEAQQWVLTAAQNSASPEAKALATHYLNLENKVYREQLAELTELRGEENEILTEQPSVMIMNERAQVRPSFILDRGAYDAPTEQVYPGTPKAVMAFGEEYPQNRLGLAQWLLDEKNPLFTRVSVNRYWQMYFGQGLVKTADDFGNQGDLPTHPKLLDWLSIEFRESGWDVRALQKKIVMSATYRQASAIRPELMEKNPDNKWLAHGPAYRWPAEVLRDNALAASGLLVREVGGPSVKPYQPPGLWKELATRNVTRYVQDHGDSLYRRSMYTIWKRTSPPPSMITFDATTRDFCEVRRQKTNTPLQALVLLNDPQFIEAARVLAARSIGESEDLKQQIAHIFESLTGRAPIEAEVNALERLYQQEREAYQQAPTQAEELLAIGEYPLDPELPKTELAALTLVANTLMSFDEVVSKR